MLKDLIKSNKYFFYFLLVFIAITIFINPTRNFPINDDWDNQLQVMAFRTGEYRIHSAIDASFILQPWLGYIWSLVFGYSFVSLRFLTLLFAIILSYLIYIVASPHMSEKMVFVVLCGFMFHPILLHSSLTFMTEIYFLTGILASFYFFEKYLKTERYGDYIIASVLLGLTILFRQLAVVSFVAYLLVLIIRKKATLKNILILTLFTGLGILIWQLYPRAGIPEEIIYTFVEKKLFAKRVEYMFYLIPFFGFGLIPYLFTKQKPRIVKLILLVVSLLGALLLLEKDVLPLGNVFYIECILCRTKYRQIFSVFDNVVFKYFCSFAIVYSLSNFVYLLTQRVTRKMIEENLHLILLFLGYTSVLLFPEDLYDRYAIVALLFLTLFVARNISEKISRVGLIVLVSLSFVLNFEFYRVAENIYEQVLLIKNDYGYISSVHSYDIYSRYLETLAHEDYAGVYNSSYSPTAFVCYVQSYTEETNTRYSRFIDQLEDLFNKVAENPDIYGRYKRSDIRWIKNYKDRLIYNKEYPSILFNLVGRRAYVGSYCVDPGE